jgi:sugar-specific transcriptional regulator TrmB
MIETLVNMGFTETDAQVYVYLAMEGPQKFREIADSLKIFRTKLYTILNNLQNLGLVETSSKYPTRFSAVLFEKVLDQLSKVKVSQQQFLENNKEELISAWRSLTKKDKADS